MTTGLLERPGSASEILDDLTRRELITAVIGAGLAGACGSRGSGGGGSVAPAGTRSIQHALGEADVPIAPSRVVPLDLNELEQVVALGLDPVGTIPDEAQHDYLPESAFDVPAVLTDAYEVDLEVVAGLRPDLIIGPVFYVEPLYSQLQQIAPTVAVARSGFQEWKGQLRLVAEVLGRPEAADRLLEGFEAELNRVRDAIGAERIAATTVTHCLPFEDQIYIYVEGFANTVLCDLGFQAPPAQRAALPEGSERIETSLEQIPLLDADVIFRGRLADFPSAIDSNPLWQRLPAVVAGRVVDVDGQVWNQGSVLAARAVLADIERAFASQLS